MNDKGKGMLLVVSGPSGSGKSTLVEELMRLNEFPITFSVSATSRPPRPGEIEGKHYHFLERQRFEELRDQNEFLEHAHVHGHLYGTLRAPVTKALEEGRWVLLEIDVQGYQQICATMPEAASFFIRTPSLEGYEERLRARGTETEEIIAKRLAAARNELEHASKYDYQIVNETVAQAVRTMRTLLWGLRTQRGLQNAG